MPASPTAHRASADSPTLRALTEEMRQLYEALGDCLDDDRIEEWPQYFTDDCEYRVISKENHDEGLPHSTLYCDGIAMIHDRVMAYRKAQIFEPRALRHFISGVRVLSENSGLIEARANFLITEAMSDEEPRVLMVGRYLDTVVRDGTLLRLRKHTAVFDNHRVFRSIVLPV
jgi:anthranilate 1,2-dioxygenase small subunit